MRVDKYLKVSRLIKRRTVATEACDNKKIYVNSKAVKPSYNVKVGDILEIRFTNSSVKVRITDISETVRKEQASSLYEIID